MAVQKQYLTYVVEQLEGLGPLRQNPMFGGVGLYSAGSFFGFLDDDALFLKADARNVGDFVARHMPRFMAAPSRPAGTPGYYQVPADVLEDPELLVKWARTAVAVALDAQAKKAQVKKAQVKKAQVKNARVKSPQAANKRATTRTPARKRTKPKPRRAK